MWADTTSNRGYDTTCYQNSDLPSSWVCLVISFVIRSSTTRALSLGYLPGGFVDVAGRWCKRALVSGPQPGRVG